MNLSCFCPNKDIPETPLYFMIRGLHGQKAVATERVETIRSFMKRKPELGMEAEGRIAELYGIGNSLLCELDERYKKRSKSMKISYWSYEGDDFAKLFVQGQIKRVIKSL